MKKKYEMTEEDLEIIKDACKPVPMIALNCGTPSSPQENANAAWERLGKKMGFFHTTVEPAGKGGERFFIAEEIPRDKSASDMIKGLPDGSEFVDGSVYKKFNKITEEYDFQQVVEPVMDWLSKNSNPHTKVEITQDSAEILSGEYMHKTDAFIRD